MPIGSKKPCGKPGCYVLVHRTERYCEAHRKSVQRQVFKDRMADPVKRERHRFYQSKQWLEARAAYLAAHPLCVDCNSAGMFVSATVVDHIKEVKVGGSRLDSSNFQSLCASHHAKKTRRDGGAW